jgi:hypothetical protein
MGKAARAKRDRETALKLTAPILAPTHKPGDIYIDPDWGKWLFLAAFYDNVATAHAKAGHILTREEFMKAGAVVMLPNECIAIIAVMGMPFRFMTEKVPDLLAERRAAERHSGLVLARG